MNLPESIEHTLNVLNDNGFSSYVVGECVRDYLLGKEPSDYEVVTSALPEQIKTLFEDYDADDT